jgi:hypothetical protein
MAEERIPLNIPGSGSPSSDREIRGNPWIFLTSH